MKRIGILVIVLVTGLPLVWLVVLAVPQLPLLWAHTDYWRGYLVSAGLTVTIVVLQLAVALPASFGLARWRSRVKNGVYFLYGLLVLLPAQVMLLPNYLVCRTVGLLNSWTALLLIGVFSPVSVCLLTRSMQRIGWEQGEAASLDGAGEWTIFSRIYLPQVKDVGLIACIVAFLDSWSMIELPLVLLSDAKKQPLSVLLGQADFPAVYAGAAVYTVPAVVTLLLALAFSYRRDTRALKAPILSR